MNDGENFDMLQSLLDCSSDFMVLLSPKFEVLAHNTAAAKYLSLYFENPLTNGADYRDFVVKDVMRIFLNAFRKARSGDITILEHFTESEKAAHWFEYKMGPIYDKKGKLVAINLLARNIDLEKLVEAERKYLADTFEVIVQNATEAIVFLDCDGKVLQYNNNAKERLLLNFGGKIKINDDFRHFVYPDLIEAFSRDFENSLKGKFSEKEYQTKNIDDESICIRVRMYPVSQDGIIVGVTLFVLDTLEQNQTASLNQLQLEKLKDISWHHSHVLRSPVANILGITNVLRDSTDLTQEEYKRWLNLLFQCTEELDGVIQTIVNKALSNI